MKKCSKGAYEDYSVHDGFLFKGAKLCIPKSSFRELLIRETHGGGLAGHFGINKTLDMLKQHFYWPKMVGDVQAVVARCVALVKGPNLISKQVLTCLCRFQSNLGKI